MTDQKQPDVDKVIEQVRKMWAHAQSAEQIGSLEEAKAFAEAVEKTLAAHKLSFDVLSVQQKDAQDPMGRNDVRPLEGKSKQKRVWWTEQLAGIVAKAHFCQMIPYSDTDHVIIIGRQSDREVASYMITVLTRLAQELCDSGYWKARYLAFKNTGTYDTGNFKENFFQGFLDGMRERYDQLKAAERKTSSGMSMVLVRSEQEVQDYIKTKMSLTKARAPGRKDATENAMGYGAGRNAAKAANINKGTGAGETKKGLSKPTSQLGRGE